MFPLKNLARKGLNHLHHYLHIPGGVGGFSPAAAFRGAGCGNFVGVGWSKLSRLIRSALLDRCVSMMSARGVSRGVWALALEGIHLKSSTGPHFNIKTIFLGKGILITCVWRQNELVVFTTSSFRPYLSNYIPMQPTNNGLNAWSRLVVDRPKHRFVSIKLRSKVS